jgi:hypothetical protein
VPLLSWALFLARPLIFHALRELRKIDVNIKIKSQSHKMNLSVFTQGLKTPKILAELPPREIH